MTAHAVRRFCVWLLCFAILLPTTAVYSQDPSALSEHYSTETTIGQFSFDYPSGWAIDPNLEPGAVWLSSNSHMLTSNDYLPEEVIVAIVLPDALNILELELPDDNLSARGVIDAFVKMVAPSDLRGSIATAEIGGKQTVWIDLVVENEEGMVVAVELDGYVSVVLAAALPGEFEAFRETVNNIVASIELEIRDEFTDDAPDEGGVVFEGYYENDVSGLAFQFPDTWLVRDDQVPGVTFMASSDTILDSGDPVAGGILLIVLTEQAFAETFGDDLGTNPTEIVENTVDSFLLPVAENLSIKPFMVGQYEAARTGFLSETAEGAVIAIDLEDRFGIVVAATSIGEFEDFEATILSIADSITVVEESVVETQAYSSREFAFTFDYPLGWHIDESEAPELIVVGNVGSFNVDQLGTGEILVFVFDPLQSGFPERLSLLEMADAWQTVIEDGETEASQVQTVRVGGLDAARIDVVSAQGDGMVLVVDVGDGSLAVVVASTAHDEFGDFEAAVLDLAGSVAQTELP